MRSTVKPPASILVGVIRRRRWTKEKANKGCMAPVLECIRFRMELLFKRARVEGQRMGN